MLFKLLDLKIAVIFFIVRILYLKWFYELQKMCKGLCSEIYRLVSSKLCMIVVTTGPYSSVSV